MSDGICGSASKLGLARCAEIFLVETALLHHAGMIVYLLEDLRLYT